MRIQFLVEVEARGVADLAELNRLFTAWVETVYHRRVHSETRQAPIERLGAGAARRCPPGGIFVAGSLAWGVVVDGFRPDRFDLVGAALCLIGVAVIVYAPR